MEKKTYIKPRTKKVFLAIEQLMLVASPGVGGGYNPHKPIESKGADFFDEEETEAIEPQGYNSVWDH